MTDHDHSALAEKSAARLREARDCLHSVYQGKDYEKFIRPWVDGLRRIMVAKQCTAIEAMMHVLDGAKRLDADYGATAIAVMAATLEIYEGNYRHDYL